MITQAESVLEMAIPGRTHVALRVFMYKDVRGLRVKPVLYDLDDNELPALEQEQYATQLFLQLLNESKSVL